jgi:hypothetical protein
MICPSKLREDNLMNAPVQTGAFLFGLTPTLLQMERGLSLLYAGTTVFLPAIICFC